MENLKNIKIIGKNFENEKYNYDSVNGLKIMNKPAKYKPPKYLIYLEENAYVFSFDEVNFILDKLTKLHTRGVIIDIGPFSYSMYRIGCLDKKTIYRYLRGIYRCTHEKVFFINKTEYQKHVRKKILKYL